MTDTQQAWWAKAVLIGGVIAVVCLPLGALGYRAGVWSVGPGLLLVAVGGGLAAITAFLGIIALVVAVVKKLSAERGSTAVGLVLAAVVLGMVIPQMLAAGSVPQIHNISTDTEDPPAFDAIVALRGSESNPHTYDREALAEVQRAAYPDLSGRDFSFSVGEGVNRAAAVLKEMGLEVVNVDAAAGIVEATDTTFWFGFKDDMVVRVRAQGAGSRVDVRSVSRVGQSDLGVNAARIKRFLNAL